MQILAGFQSKYNLSDRVTTGIMKMIKVHMPSNHSYPASSRNLMKSLVKDDIRSKIYFCVLCSQLLEDLTCPGCQQSFIEKELEERHQYFFILDVRQQLEMILKNDKVRRLLSSKIFREQDTHLNSTGRGLLKIKDDPFDLSCTFNSDGVQLFESSNSSVWPFLISLNDLPFQVRKQFIILGGLWFCGSKVNMEMFLNPIAKMLASLFENPISWKADNGAVLKSRILFPVCAVDSPARCKMQGLVQFNGKHGCCWCDHPGKRVPKGRGYARVYPSQEFNPAARSNVAFKQQVRNNDFTMGLKYNSPLNQIPKFDIVRGFSVDMMHCVMLGVVRHFTCLWLECSGSPYNVSLSQLDNRLLKCRVPSEINRSFRSLSHRKQWKASEWQNWLFVSPLLLRGLLGRKYINHFKLLVESVHMLCRPTVYEDELNLAERDITAFVKSVKVLYGEEHCTYNVHILLHLVSCVRDWGPLMGSSAFSFESFNGELVSKVTSSKGVLYQITRRYLTTLRSRLRGELQEDYHDILGYNFLPKHEVRKKKSIAVGSLKHFDQINGYTRVKSVQEGTSAFINFKYYNTVSSRSKKKADNIVMLDEKNYGLIETFYEVECECADQCECEKMFALIGKIEVSQSKRLSFCKYSDSSVMNFVVKPFTAISKFKFYVYDADDFCYYVCVPHEDYE